MGKVLFCHILDPVNIGDQVCCPRSYFDWIPHETSEIDIRAELSCFYEADAVVFGGGGMLYEGGARLMGRIWSECRKRGIKVFGWGFGTNLIGKTEQTWPRFLKYFEETAIRDPSSPYRYVPCPSCLLGHIRHYRTEKPTRPEVYYDHWQRLPIPGDGPRMTNARAPGDIARVIEFLASAETIHTSTFHGAYWGMLLNRKVVIPEKWASRFFSLPQCPGSEYYTSCVELNREYYLDVLEKLR